MKQLETRFIHVEEYENEHFEELMFVKNLGAASGLTKAQMAEKMSLTQQGFFYLLRENDMKLSHVYTLCDNCNIGMYLYIMKESDHLHFRPNPNEYTYDINNKITNPMIFLDLFCEQYKISIKQIAEALSMHPNSILHWRRVKDCYISAIFKIAKAFNMNVYIYFDKKTEIHNMENTGHKLFYSITQSFVEDF